MKIFNRVTFLYLILVAGAYPVIAEETSLTDTTKKVEESTTRTVDPASALDGFMAILAEHPDDTDALEGAAKVAGEMGLQDMSADFLRQRVEIAVTNDDKETAQAINQKISDLYDVIPDALTQKLDQAKSYSADQAGAAAAFKEMTADAQTALKAGNNDEAVAAEQGALAFATDSFGPNHWFTVSAERDLGFIYRQLGMAQEAETYYGEALDGAEQLLGKTHPKTLEINEYVAELYGAMGYAEESSLISGVVIAGYKSSLGEAHPLSLNSRFSAINNLQNAGKFDDALTQVGALCQFIDGAYGSYHPQAVNCLQTTAGILTSMGKLEEAQSTYKQVIARMGAVKSDVDAYVLNALLEVAEIYRVLGHYKESKDLLSQVILTSLLVGDVERSYTAKSYLGRVLNNEGELDKAQQLTEEVLDYGVKAWTSVPANVYNTLLELGSIYQAQGKLADAEATYEEALQGLTEVLGADNPSTLVAQNNLGQIYELSGLYDQAEPLLKDTLEKMEKILGEDHPNTMNVRNNLALLFESQGKFREAEPLYLKSRDMMEHLYGPDHNSTIAVNNNLAYLYMLMEDYEESAEMFEQVRQQWTTLFGESHQNTLKATNNLGRVYKRMGRLAEAETLIAKALELRQKTLGPEHMDSIRSMIDLGSVYNLEGRNQDAEKILTSALDLAETELGNLHPYTFDALNNLARVKEDENQLEAAVELRELGFNRRSDFLDTMLWATGENAREGYIRLYRPEFNDYIKLLAKMDDQTSAKRLVNASLQRKGLLLKVTSEIQQIATMTDDPKLKVLATALESARKELAAKTLSGPTAETKGRHTQVLYQLEQTVNDLQGKLGRASVRFRTSIAGASADRLESEMKDGASLVDYLAYEDKDQKKMIAAVVTKLKGKVTYSLVDYPDRDKIDKSVISYRTIIQDDLADEDELLEIGQHTYDTVWAPLMDALAGVEDVYLVPDGILNILPFNALINDDEEYLIQTHDLHMLTSGRDLLPNDYKLAEGEYLVVAGPDYDSTTVVSTEVRKAAEGRRSAALQMGIRGAGTGLRGLNFNPLPGAAEEGRIIVDQVDKSDAPSENFFGVNAQEQVLSNLKAPPQILHVATHGFFLKADDTLRKRLLKAQRSTEFHIPPPGDNPLLRAGLAFAGINANAQYLGDIDTSNDGVLTALEVLDLNLSGTRLVVLSACETGLGEIHEGEGVYGLRRAFQEAGVAEVVSSLWEVSDAGTQALMTDFYDRLLAGEEPREALRQVQLELLDSPQWGYPYIWSAFMIVGSYESSGFRVN